MALASASFTKRSAFASQVRGRCSFIAIQLTMHAAFARCATGAGASGCWRDFTHWCGPRGCGAGFHALEPVPVMRETVRHLHGDAVGVEELRIARVERLER